MLTNNNKRIITNKIVWLRESLFAHDTFLWLSKVSVVFNISSLHANTNLPMRRFSQEQFLISKYSSILHALFYS